MMKLEDLEYIFKPQIEEGTTDLYYMLIDGELNLIQRCSVNEMSSLLPMLENFVYDGNAARVPRFKK